MYPHGAAVCGALDLAGSLFEWCLNDHKKVDLISISSKEYKVLRGGSFYHDRNSAAASFRHYGYPLDGGNYFGLRLVVAAPIRL